MALDLTRVQSAVERDNTVTQSAITLLNSLAQMVRDTAGDPAAVNALADQIDANSTSLADAVSANTPSSGEPPAPSPEA